MLKNLKKVISTIAAVAILATSASAFAVDFPDVDASASYASAVELLTGLGIVDGDENGKFNPDNTVTRAEFAKMVVEAKDKGAAAASSTYTKFADAQGHWAAGYIEAGVGDGFINGYDENTFGPNDTVTYAQAVKMLVGALGYEPWAEQVGGWPAGYLSYGSTLKIVNGVTGVTNDTALTRAQCAILIANAMKAPLLEITSYQHVGTMNGTVLAPIYGQMDGTHENWQTLLTKYHDAFEVFGRVTATAKNGAKKGTVQFAVENARNIDGQYVENGAWTTSDDKAGKQAVDLVYVNGTDADDLVFEYASAVIVKDEDSKKFSFVTIDKYAESEMIELAAKDITSISSTALKVKKSEASLSTKTYDLEAPAVYVNGYYLAATEEESHKEIVTKNEVADDKDYNNDGDKLDTAVDVEVEVIDVPYVPALTKAMSFVGAANKTGKVTLIDKTATGSTATDGDYDYIMIDYTDSKMVEYTKTTSAGINEIVFADATKMTWDPEDEDTVIVFTKDGEEVAFEDIAENDVLTISMRPENASDLKNVITASAVITNDTVSGVVSRIDSDEVVVDGAEYAVLTNAFDDPSKAITNEFTLYLDANGAVVKAELIATNVNYGVVTRLMWSNEAEAYKVTVIKGDGETATFEVKDTALAALVAQIGATTVNGKYEYTYTDFQVNYATAVVKYKLQGGKFVVGEDITGVGNAAPESLEFRASNSKLGGYSIDDATTQIIDISGFKADKDIDAVAMTVDSFEDEIKYGALLFDKNNNGSYQFALVVDGTNSLRATSPIVVVKDYAGMTQVDETDVHEWVVIRNGEETTLYTTAKTLAEGDVIMYANPLKGYVDSTSIKTIATAKSTYTAHMNAATTAGLVMANIGATNVTAHATATNGYSFTFAANNDVELYAGIVYAADMSNLSMFTKVESVTVDTDKDGVDDTTWAQAGKVADTKDLSIAGANMTTYNYNVVANEGYRVEAGAVSVIKALFNPLYDADKNEVNFAAYAAQEVEPTIAIVRVVENDVTDVIYYTFN